MYVLKHSIRANIQACHIRITSIILQSTFWQKKAKKPDASFLTSVHSITIAIKLQIKNVSWISLPSIRFARWPTRQHTTQNYIIIYYMRSYFSSIKKTPSRLYIALKWSPIKTPIKPRFVQLQHSGCIICPQTTPQEQ